MEERRLPSCRLRICAGFYLAWLNGKQEFGMKHSMTVLYVANAKKEEKIYVEKRENGDGSVDLGDV